MYVVVALLTALLWLEMTLLRRLFDTVAMHIVLLTAVMAGNGTF